MIAQPLGISRETFPVISAACRWFALVVRPRHEKAVAHYLQAAGFDVLSPTYTVRRRWSDRLKTLELPLFNGYVFCSFGFEDRLHVLGTPGVRSMVTFARVPQAIPDDEIRAIQAIVRSGSPAVPWPYLRIGQKVRVVGGCLNGVAGTLVREKNVFRVVVNIEMLERSVAVEVERGSIVPA